MSRTLSGWLSKTILVTVGLSALWSSGCSSGKAPDPLPESDAPAGQENIGERVFLDTRFAEYFAQNMTGVNDPLTVGDPVVAQVTTPVGVLPGPFAGQSINCRSCHFVTEFINVPQVRNRTYADFVDHSPIPRIMNGFTSTPRNAMQMVGSLQPHNGPIFLHFDGEFTTPEDLVQATLTGRNFGWEPYQKTQAVAHVARVIREDNGQDSAAANFGCGLPYAKIFLGTDSSIPSDCKIAPQYRIDVTTASDQAVVEKVAMVVAAYAEGLRFKQDELGRFIASPYDVFLRANHLPTAPIAGETETQYAQRLLGLVENLDSPVFLDGSSGTFKYHPQPFVFGTIELQGLRVFLRAALGAVDGSQHAGNCASCHLPPNFTDFRFHNNGSTQEEYDAANGAGAFLRLQIPTQAERIQNPELYMPASGNHPNASERFRHPAVAGNPIYADLGLWNVYLNPDIPNPQANLNTIVCAIATNCTTDQGLAVTIAQFKTPTLRDLEDSAPYFHNGSKPKFDDVVKFYINASQLARQGKLRNGAWEFAGMSLSVEDIDALVAFLKALTEDYDDA